MIVVFFLIFLPVFSALFFGLKVPNPLRYTPSLADIESFISFINDSTTAKVVNFSTPVFSAILLTSSAFVVSFSFYINFLTNFERANILKKIALLLCGCFFIEFIVLFSSKL